MALCTHNGSGFIEEQLRSILAQTCAPTEIVVSDDASTDETVALVRRTLAEHLAAAPGSPISVRVLENPEPLGIALNFERAVTATTGELIALSDQDDRWHDDRLERAATEFQRRPQLTLLFSDATLVDAAGAPIGHSLFEALGVTSREHAAVRTGAAFSALLRRNLVTGATTMFRRSLLDVALPFAPGWLHDEWLAIIASAVGEVGVLDESLIDYRQHGGNAIGARRLSLAFGIRRLLESREGRNRRLADNASALVDRVRELGERTTESTIAGARGKLAHEQLRNSLPAARLRRIRPVVSEVARHGYSRYGRGARDIVRDIIQPV